MPANEQSLRLASKLLSRLPSSLIVNGVTFSRCTRDATPGTYAGPAQQRVSFISLVFDPRLGRARAPREVTVSGRRFTRRCESYYLPLDASAKDVERLFDYMAPRYEILTDTALNESVAHRLLDMAMRDHPPRAGNGLRIADFGCGSGTSWQQLTRLARSNPEFRQVELFGCDLSEKMVDISRQRGLKRAFRCDYADTPFDSGFFDVVIATFVIHYFSDHQPLGEIARILKPGGHFIASLPATEHKALDRYWAMLHKEPRLGQLEVSAIETDAEQPRSIPVFRCERSKAEPLADSPVGEDADFPDESLLV